MIKLNKYVVLK